MNGGWKTWALGAMCSVLVAGVGLSGKFVLDTNAELTVVTTAHGVFSEKIAQNEKALERIESLLKELRDIQWEMYKATPRLSGERN